MLQNVESLWIAEYVGFQVVTLWQSVGFKLPPDRDRKMHRLENKNPLDQVAFVKSTKLSHLLGLKSDVSKRWA